MGIDIVKYYVELRGVYKRGGGKIVGCRGVKDIMKILVIELIKLSL